MNWIALAQTLAVLLNLGSMLMNMWSSRKARNQYADLTRKTIDQLNEQRDEYHFHIDRLVEEIELLKTSEGLYNLRNDEEKYQMYLNLLRKK